MTILPEISRHLDEVIKEQAAKEAPSSGSARRPCSASLVPKSAYNVGDEVLVRCEEGPTFPATISGVRWEGRINHVNQHWYEITEEDAGVSDGYTDEWLSPLNSPGQASGISG